MAIEIWWLSLTLSVASIGFGFEVHSRFTPSLRLIQERRMAKGRDEIRAILKDVKTKPIGEIEDTIFALGDYRESASAPRQRLAVATQYFFFSAFVFIASFLVRLGLDSGMLDKSYSALEGMSFFFGLITFAISVITSYQLTRLEDREGE